MNRYRFSSNTPLKRWFPEEGDVYSGNGFWYMLHAIDYVVGSYCLRDMADKTRMTLANIKNLQMHYKFLGNVGGKLWKNKANGISYTVCYDTDTADNGMPNFRMVKPSTNNDATEQIYVNITDFFNQFEPY